MVADRIDHAGDLVTVDQRRIGYGQRQTALEAMQHADFEHEHPGSRRIEREAWGELLINDQRIVELALGLNDSDGMHRELRTGGAKPDGAADMCAFHGQPQRPINDVADTLPPASAASWH